MSPTCDYDPCGRWIERNNRTHPGYCSPTCRDQAHAERADWLEAKRRARLARRTGDQS